MKPEINWHLRYRQQANWTEGLRKYLFAKAHLHGAKTVLEVGCGTGAVLIEIADLPQVGVHALDIDPSRLIQSHQNVPSSILTNGDALALPYRSQSFDITFCHFLLLWVKDPVAALCEMHRVTRPGGTVLVLAEPDYSQRVDLPLELASLGDLQTNSLVQQGADPSIGSRLVGLFEQANINLVESGRLEMMPSRQFTRSDWEQEWAVLSSDLAGMIKPAELDRLHKIDEHACQLGKRTLYVPTYYAWGWV